MMKGSVLAMGNPAGFITFVVFMIMIVAFTMIHVNAQGKIIIYFLFFI